MTKGQPKHFQGRKPSRIKPMLSVPLEATGAHKKIDKVLSRPEREAAERELIKARKSHNRAVQRAKEIHKRAMKACRRGLHPPETPHRHNYKKLLRVDPVTGNRVVGCNCSAYTVVPPEGKSA